METALKLFVWIAYILLDVWLNYKIIEVDDHKPNYLLLNIIRGAAFILYGAFVWDFQAEIWYLNIFIFCVASFWIFFDLWLNVVRGKHPLYIGANSGWIDRFGYKHPGIYYFCKACVLVILILSTINIYNP